MTWLGHLWNTNTLDVVRARFFWPHIAEDVQKKDQTCEACIKGKVYTERALLVLAPSIH